MVAIGRIRSNTRHAAAETGYTTPEIIDPPNTICICVPVPDERFHRAAFLGQMLELAKWYTWQKDDAHTGKDVAAVWMPIFENVREQMQMSPRNCGCGCGESAQQRLNADGTIDISTDGGVTWTPATPAQDPRTSGSYQPPIDTSDSTEKCAAANSAVAYFKQKQAEAYARMSGGATVAELATLFIAFLVAVGVIATGGALAVLGAGVGALLASFDATSWNALFTDDLWTDLLCAIDCAMDSTGQVMQADVLQMAVDFRAAHPDRAGEFIGQLLTGMGQVGLTNAIRLGLDGSLSCEDCDCPIDCGDPSLVTIGTVTASGIDENGRKYLHIASDTFSTFQNISIGTYGEPSPPNTCCHIFGWGVISGAVNSTGYTDCAGGVHDPGNPETHDCGHATWNTAPGDGTPFEISVTFGS